MHYFGKLYLAPNQAWENRWTLCNVCFRVRKQVVNIPSYIVRLDSQKHIDFSLNSPYGGGRPGKPVIIDLGGFCNKITDFLNMFFFYT